MSVNSLDVGISRRNWLKVATGLGALGLMSPQQSNTVGQLLAQEETPATERSLVDTPPKLLKDSAAALFNLKREDPKYFLNTNGRDIAHEILRGTSKKSFANKTWIMKEKDWDYVKDLREFAMHVADANDPKREAKHFIVRNLRKPNSVKVDLDDIVFFGTNVRSAWLASLTVAAIAAGWSKYTLPQALELINASLDVLNYHESSRLIRRDIEKVIANQLFGESAQFLLTDAFKPEFHPYEKQPQYRSDKSFNDLELNILDYDKHENFRLSELHKADEITIK